MAEDSLTYGFHPVRELLLSRPQSVVRVLIARGRGGGRRAQIEALCRRRGVEIEEVGAEELRSASRGGVHNGFVAHLRAPVEPRPRGRDARLVLLLEDVQDPRNLGALLRVCEGVGVGRVLVRDRGSAPLSPVVEKASAGASQWLEIERITNSGNEIRTLKKQGFWVYGADAGGKPPWEIDLSGPLLLCLGGEQRGLRPKTRTLCDDLLGLPMRGRLGSLNVATAASAILYEALRQRLAQTPSAGREAETPTADRQREEERGG